MPDTLTATLDPDNSRTSVSLSWTSTPVPATATIERIDSSGAITAVRGAELATLVAGAWAGLDYEAPLDEPFTYRATSTARPGESVTSPQYTLTSAGRTWLKHPGRPFLNTTVEIGQAPDWSRPTTQGVFDVLGRTSPIAVTMRRSAPRGDLVVNTVADADAAALRALLDDGSPLYLQTPDGYGVGNVYVSVGDVAEARLTHVGTETARRWTLPLIVVDRPAGGVIAFGNSWSDVLGEYASWSALLEAEGTWESVLEGIGD